TMADVNVNAPANQAPIMAPPTRTDDQIVAYIRWRALTTIINLCLTGRLHGLKGQWLKCCRFFGASSIEPISIMQRGSRKNSPNPSIPSLKTKRIWHNILTERRKLLLL
nr:hypothetical protein [Tanacetum cinerariifolium]